MHGKIVVAENGEDSLFRDKEKKSLEGLSDEVFADKYLVHEQSSVLDSGVALLFRSESES